MHTALVVFPEEQAATAKDALEARRFEVFVATTFEQGVRSLHARPRLVFVAATIAGNCFIDEVDPRFSTLIVCYNGLREDVFLETALREAGLMSGLDSISSGGYIDYLARRY